MSIRVNGVGALGVSVQWEYLEGNEAVARRVLIDLEDRRVLFDHYGREDPEYCRRSADEIRRLMTKELPNVKPDDQMDEALRTIRQAAREFCSGAGPDACHFRDDYQTFSDALVKMRGTMAGPIRSMAMAYRIQLDQMMDHHLPPLDLSFVPGFD